MKRFALSFLTSLAVALLCLMLHWLGGGEFARSEELYRASFSAVVFFCTTFAVTYSLDLWGIDD